MLCRLDEATRQEKIKVKNTLFDKKKLKAIKEKLVKVVKKKAKTCKVF